MVPIEGPVPGSFDRIADHYDSTRGGDTRGEALADGLAELLGPNLKNSAVLEVGVGTAVVAAALRKRGRTVIGIDISPKMLRVAGHRLPGSLALADAAMLPIGTSAVTAVYGIWVLHVVKHPFRVVAEVARVLRDGGKFIYVPSRPDRPLSDVDEVLATLGVALRGGAPRPDGIDAVRGFATGAGLTENRKTFISVGNSPLSPATAIRQVTDRIWSPLWSSTEEQWRRHVLPAIDALAALPDQHRPRANRSAYDVLVFRKSTTDKSDAPAGTFSCKIATQ